MAMLECLQVAARAYAVRGLPGDKSRALGATRRGVAVAERALGPGHDEVRRAQSEAGRVAGALLEQWNEALEFATEALETLRRQGFSDSDPKVKEASKEVDTYRRKVRRTTRVGSDGRRR